MNNSNLCSLRSSQLQLQMGKMRTITTAMTTTLKLSLVAVINTCVGVKAAMQGRIRSLGNSWLLASGWFMELRDREVRMVENHTSSWKCTIRTSLYLKRYLHV